MASLPLRTSELTVSAICAPRSILYVEDDADTREAVCAVLEDEGYRVEPAESLAEALMAMAREDFDLVLTDYNLPDGTGASLIRRGRATGDLDDDTPALLVTATPDPEPVSGVPIIPKPLTPAQLLVLVRTAIGVRRRVGPPREPVTVSRRCSPPSSGRQKA